jgi:hypothetical protein
MGKFNENSRIKELIQDDRAAEIIDRYLPGILKHPGLKMALLVNPTIRQALPYRKHIEMSDETLNALTAEIYALD